MNKLLKQLEEFGKKNYMFNISRKTGEFLNHLIKTNKPKNILEIGTSNGYSTIWLAIAAKEINAKITTIEQNQEKIKLAQKNFQKAGLTNIIIIHGNALEEIKKLKQKFDFVFIDAIKKEYFDYLLLLLPKLKKGSIITAHNVISHKEKLKTYLEFVQNRFKTKILKEIDLAITVI